MIKAVIVYNPRGGQVVVRHELDGVAGYLEENSWEVTIEETTRPKEATEIAQCAVERGADIVVAAGGDGTVSEVAAGLIDSTAVLGVLPLGTTNSWAIQMGIPALSPLLPSTGIAKIVADIEERTEIPVPVNYYRKVLLDAAKVLAERNVVSVDMGDVSGRRFLMWAGIGLDAQILGSVPAAEKAALGSWAYWIRALGAIGKSCGTDIKFRFDGVEKVINSPLIVVSNIQLYGGVMAIGAKAQVNDGLLDVCIFKGDGFFTFAQHAINIFSGQHLTDPKTEYYQCREVIIEPECPLPVHVDGESCTQTPVTIRALPSALKTIVPKSAPGGLFGRI